MHTQALNASMILTQLLANTCTYGLKGLWDILKAFDSSVGPPAACLRLDPAPFAALSFDMITDLDEKSVIIFGPKNQ